MHVLSGKMYSGSPSTMERKMRCPDLTELIFSYIGIWLYLECPIIGMAMKKFGTPHEMSAVTLNFWLCLERRQGVLIFL